MRVFTVLSILCAFWPMCAAEDQCIEEDWNGSFGLEFQDSKSQCSNAFYVAGFRSAGWPLSDGPAVVSKAKCCKVETTDSDCVETELKASDSGWAECPAGRLFQGFITVGGEWVTDIKQGLCCKRTGSPDVDEGCQDVDVDFTTDGLYDCPDGLLLKGYHLKCGNTMDCIKQFRCCRRKPGWSAWSAWSACDQTCGGGAKEKTRTCQDNSPYQGLIRQTKQCARKPCY